MAWIASAAKNTSGRVYQIDAIEIWCGHKTQQKGEAEPSDHEVHWTFPTVSSAQTWQHEQPRKSGHYPPRVHHAEAWHGIPQKTVSLGNQERKKATGVGVQVVHEVAAMEDG